LFEVIICQVWNACPRQANISGRKLDLNKIWFLHLHYILEYSFWVRFESEKLESLYWHLEKTQGHSMRPTAMITICKYDKVLIYCALLTLQRKQSFRSTFVQVRDTWSLKCSIVQLDQWSWTGAKSSTKGRFYELWGRFCDLSDLWGDFSFEGAIYAG